MLQAVSLARADKGLVALPRGTKVRPTANLIVRPGQVQPIVPGKDQSMADGRRKSVKLCNCVEAVEQLLENNKAWVKDVKTMDADFFEARKGGQAPPYLWLGCSDSRVPPNQLLGLMPGEVFVHRNIGNIINLSDLNCMTVLEYSVGVLKVKHILVCGHYNCGAVRAALELARDAPGVVNNWIDPIRRVAIENEEELSELGEMEAINRLAELAVEAHVKSVSMAPAVQRAWKQNQELTIQGMVYSLESGLLKPVGEPVLGCTIGAKKVAAK